jgi:hypothetical protein
MTQLNNRKKRSKLTRFLLSPLMLIVFMAGWSLYSIGEPSHQNNIQPQKPTNNTSKKQDEIEFSIISQEEQMITT